MASLLACFIRLQRPPRPLDHGRRPLGGECDQSQDGRLGGTAIRDTLNFTVISFFFYISSWGNRRHRSLRLSPIAWLQNVVPILTFIHGVLYSVSAYFA